MKLIRINNPSLRYINIPTKYLYVLYAYDNIIISGMYLDLKALRRGFEKPEPCRTINYKEYSEYTVMCEFSIDYNKNQNNKEYIIGKIIELLPEEFL